VIDSDQSVALALIAHEAVVNALKHGPAESRADVDIALRRVGERLRLEVANACGPASAGPGPGNGLQIARALARQLDGTVGFATEAGRARFHLEFVRRAARDAAPETGALSPLPWAPAPG
jgi:two-component sensor histidine kinase